MKKAIFLFKKLKTILNRIRKHALFGRKFLTFAHVPRLETFYPWPVSYCVSLIMVTITRHIFINIFQTEQFSAVKFALSYEKM